MMLAVWSKAPEFALTEPESKEIAKAISKVSEHYDMTMDPKTGAWVNLAMVLGACYGPRVFAYRARKENERKAARPKMEAAPVMTPTAAPPNADGETPPNPQMLLHMGTASKGDIIN